MSSFENNVLWTRVINDLKEKINNIVVFENLLKSNVLIKEPNSFIINTSLLSGKFLKENFFKDLNVLIQKHFKNSFEIFFVDINVNNNDKFVEKEKIVESRYVEKENNFENLIEHEGNERAICLAKKIVKDWNGFTPITVFYGEVGTGKTHLANSIANEYIKLNSKEKVCLQIHLIYEMNIMIL